MKDPPRCRVIVMAKAPVPGQVKTRLTGVLGAHGAARLAARMLRETVARAHAAGLGPVELCASPGPDHPEVLAALGPEADRLETTAQGDGDLGARMQRALERGLAADGRALLIGTDCPGLGESVLCAAAAALDAHDAVFVPAIDGGYVLVGLRRPVPSAFSEIPWSTPQVMACTRAQLTSAGIAWAELAPLPDVDEPADLVHLPAGWCNPALGQTD